MLSAGDAAILEQEYCGVGGLDAQLVLETSNAQARCVTRNDERLDGRSTLRLVDRRPHDDVRRTLTGGDEDLLAVENPLVAVENGGGGHCGGVGTETRFGDGHRGPHLAETFELFVGGHCGDRGVAEPLVGDREHESYVAPRCFERVEERRHVAAVGVAALGARV
jgi:hypothetical protein